MWTASFASIEPVARDAFLCRLIDHWEHRYAIWQRTEGESERSTNPGNPIGAEGFVLMLAGPPHAHVVPGTGRYLARRVRLGRGARVAGVDRYNGHPPRALL